MVVKTIKLSLFILLIAASVESCYYDKKEDLYVSTCNTAGMTYTKDIVSLVNSSCAGCHSGNSPSAGIALSTYAEVKDCVVNGKFLGSVKQDGTASAMPKGGKWSSCNVSKLEAWKAAGCPL
jgi:hypothetical protein